MKRFLIIFAVLSRNGYAGGTLLWNVFIIDIMRRNLFKYVLVAVLLLCSVGAMAQRQTMGRPSINAYVTLGWPGLDNFGLRGGGFSWRNYDFYGCTSLGADFSLFPAKYNLFTEAIYDKDGTLIAPEVNEDYTYTAFDITAAEGYYLRVVATRSRSFIVNIGATLHEGVRLVPDAKLIDQKMTGFIMAAEPELELEFFPFHNVSFFVSAKARMCFVNTLKAGDWFRYGFGVGTKVYL